jgi:hypothetical protein
MHYTHKLLVLPLNLTNPANVRFQPSDSWRLKLCLLRNRIDEFFGPVCS